MTKKIITILILLFTSCSSKDTESLRWFKILETKDVKLIKESFKDKYINFTNSKGENSILYVSRNDVIHTASKPITKESDYQIIKFLLEKGVNPNHIDNKNNTLLDYLIMEGGPPAYVELLYKYKPKRTCEIKKTLCSKGFRKYIILRGIYMGIVEGNTEFLKYWIKYNRKSFLLKDVYPIPIINLFEQKLNISITEIDFLKLFNLHKDSLNKIIKKKTFLDVYLDYFSSNEIKNKDVLNMFKKHGAKRACEILKTKCDDIKGISSGDK